MGKETDEFGEFVETPKADEFGEFVSTEKKNSTNQSTTTSTSSAAPVQQPTAPTVQNGTPDKFLQEANATFKTPDEKGLVNGQVVGTPTQKPAKDELKKNLADKSIQRNLANNEAVASHNTATNNGRDANIQELQALYNQLDNLRNQTNVISGMTEADVMKRINEISTKKVEPTIVGQDANGQPIIKQAPYDTYGDMYDATLKASLNFNAKRDEVHKLNAEIDPHIDQMRKDAGYKYNTKDAQGNEYYTRNPLEAFADAFGSNVETIQIGLQNLTGNKQEAMDAMQKKWVTDNVIYPKQTEGAISTGAEMLGGVAPLVVGTVASGGAGGIGALAASSLLFGAQDYGGTLYGSYSQAKAEGLSDEEAMQKAESNARMAGIKGMALGASLPMQGALGRKIFLNGAEAGAFKTFLAEQSVMAPAFGSSTAIQNWYEGKPIEEGVGKSMVDAFIIGGMTHALSHFPQIPAKIKGAFENAVAKNYGPLATTINNAVESGVLDYATAHSIMARSKAFDIVGKDNPPKAEAKLVDLGIALNEVAKNVEDIKKANPLADTGHLDAEAERINKEIAETKGSPLSGKEQKEYEGLVAKRDAKPTEGGEKPTLLQSEKDKIKHYEARIERAGKNEANSIAEGLGYDHAKHLLNDIEAKGLGKFETVQDVPKGVLKELEAKKLEAGKTYTAGDVVELDPTISKTENDAPAAEQTTTDTPADTPITPEAAIEDTPKPMQEDTNALGGDDNPTTKEPATERQSETDTGQEEASPEKVVTQTEVEPTEISPETKSKFIEATKLFYDIKDAEGGAKRREIKEQRDKFLQDNPSVKYIDDNIRSVIKQLEDAGLLIKKGDCP